MKTFTLEEITDKHIGKKGTTKRDLFENELRLDVLGQTIRDIRKERHLTQAELGKIVGVQKAQISKVENSLNCARFDTILKVFHALGARVNFNVELGY
ncbi:transcriptional regulator [Bacteroidia bacterium]|nr:transcriptional regulator [Bacteroidia bacterium]